jgi:pyruvate/2-oxoglutarate dehydrogenase complex dihydrolipoamide dehydrogenase (E3) component
MSQTAGTDRHFDALVLGCGSAGTTAAKRVRAAGRSVAVVERDQPGGDCPLRACVPTKALLRSAHVYALLRRAGEFGVEPGAVAFDWARVMARKEEIVGRTGAGNAEAYERQGIALFRGEASFEDDHHVRVGGSLLRGERVVIATGSKPALPDIPGLPEAGPITSVEAVSLPRLPASLVILGGGPVGCELAQLFSTFGVKVVLLHRGKEVLSREEPELGQLVREALVANGVTVLTGAEVERMGRQGGEKTVQVGAQGQVRHFSAEEVLAATGRESRTDGLNLQAAGVEAERGRVRVNELLQTSRPHIYAAGDVCGPLLYTHFAHYQGRVAAANLFAAEPAAADYRVVPRVTFTEPPVASVGLTEEQARRGGRDVRCATIEVASLGKALVESEGAGLVKLVADARTGEVLGGHAACAAAGEVIHEVAAAMAARAAAKDLAETIHAFPNFAEGVKAAARRWVETRPAE